MWEDSLKILYREAVGFVTQRAGEDAVEELLRPHDRHKHNTLKTVYRSLIDSLPAAKRVRDSPGSLEALSEPLLDFDPGKVHRRYGSDWEVLASVIIGGPSAADEGSGLEAFCRGALCGASFLCDFRSAGRFRVFIEGFLHDGMAIAVLPLLLQSEVAGLAFTNACRFLHRLGYDDYVEIDTPVRDLLCGTGVIDCRDNYEVLKALVLTARANSVSTQKVNNVFRAIGSGRIGEGGVKDPSAPKAFLEHVAPLLKPFFDPQQPS